MNTILIPTDFSAAAENAMHYGAQLAQKLKASLLLLHIYQIPIGMNEVPVMTIPLEDLKDNADAGLARCVQEIQKNFPEVSVTRESRMGLADDEIAEVAGKVNPFAIVVGSNKASGFERLLFGSTTQSLVRHAKHPVIVVPAQYTNHSTKTLVLATDFKQIASIPYAKINEVVTELDANLHVVHVQTGREEQKQSLAELEHLSPVYFIIQNEDVKEGLLRYADDVNADLLMLLPHEHNLMERLFSKQHTEAILNDAAIPVICIPA